MNCIIRKGIISDIPQVLELIKELAAFEKYPEQVINTVNQMEQDGFGVQPLFYFFVAEKENKIIGTSIYYWRYSTWRGKRLYLEDIIVTEKERNNGIGKILFEKTLLESISENCTGMLWQVLDWNTKALNFYKKYPVSISNEWVNCSIEINHITNFFAKK